MNLKNDLITSVIAVVVLTVALGVAYPLVTTGVSQVLFPHEANGSKITRDGKVVGSTLIGTPIAGNSARYFQLRPSADGYDPAHTGFSNRGPNQRSARDFYAGVLRTYLRRERPFDRGLTAAQVPTDAVTTSASGVDPHISEANARIQAHRVAAVRRIPLARVIDLVSKNTDGRSLGVLGEPGVNVLELNLALDGSRS